MSISLPQNIASVQDLEGLKRQVGELVKVLEDYLNKTTTVYYRENPNEPNPTMKKGDLLIDTSTNPPDISIYEWNGTELVPILGGGFGTTGATGATGATGPTGPSGSGSGEPVSDGMLPTPEIVFDAVTGDVVMSG